MAEPRDDGKGGEPDGRRSEGWLVRIAEGLAWFGAFADAARAVWFLLKLAGRAVVAACLVLFGR